MNDTYHVTTNHKQWRKVWLLRPTYPVRAYHYDLAWRLWRFWFRVVRRMTFRQYLAHTGHQTTRDEREPAEERV